MLETALLLLDKAWAQDPDRRVYLEVIAKHLARSAEAREEEPARNVDPEV